MPLERELATFNSRLPEFKAENEGKFVLIHGDDVAGFFSGYDDAIKAGYERYGLEPFLVKKVLAIEQAQFISRRIEPRTSVHPS